jgi:hypothetical protein
MTNGYIMLDNNAAIPPSRLPPQVTSLFQFPYSSHSSTAGTRRLESVDRQAVEADILALVLPPSLVRCAFFFAVGAAEDAEVQALVAVEGDRVADGKVLALVVAFLAVVVVLAGLAVLDIGVQGQCVSHAVRTSESLTVTEKALTAGAMAARARMEVRVNCILIAGEMVSWVCRWERRKRRSVLEVVGLRKKCGRL